MQSRKDFTFVITHTVNTDASVFEPKFKDSTQHLILPEQEMKCRRHSRLSAKMMSDLSQIQSSISDCCHSPCMSASGSPVRSLLPVL